MKIVISRIMDWIKSHWALLLFIIGCTMGIICMFANHKQQQDKIDQYIATIDNLKSKTGVIEKLAINHDTVFITTSPSLSMDEKTAGNYVNSDYKKVVGKRNKLVSGGNIVSSTVDTIYMPVYIDTMGVRRFKYSDRYLTLEGKIIKNRANIDYSIRDSLDLYNITSYRHHFLFIKWGKQDLYKIYSHNGNTKIVGFRIIKVIK